MTPLTFHHRLSRRDTLARLGHGFGLAALAGGGQGEAHAAAAALLRDGGSWPELCQVLFASSEFLHLD